MFFLLLNTTLFLRMRVNVSFLYIKKEKVTLLLCLLSFFIGNNSLFASGNVSKILIFLSAVWV